MNAFAGQNVNRRFTRNKLNTGHLQYLTSAHGLQHTGCVLIIIYLNLKKNKSNTVNLGTVSLIWVTGHVNETGRKDEGWNGITKTTRNYKARRFYCSLLLIWQGFRLAYEKRRTSNAGENDIRGTCVGDRIKAFTLQWPHESVRSLKFKAVCTVHHVSMCR